MVDISIYLQLDFCAPMSKASVTDKVGQVWLTIQLMQQVWMAAQEPGWPGRVGRALHYVNTALRMTLVSPGDNCKTCPSYPALEFTVKAPLAMLPCGCIPRKEASPSGSVIRRL